MALGIAAKLDPTHGLYHRTLGMKPDGGKPKFWLGDKEDVAQKRTERLELLWSQIEADHENMTEDGTYTDWVENVTFIKPPRPYWNDLLLAAARAIAKGEMTFALPRKDSWSPYHYALTLARMQSRFPAIQFVPVKEAESFHQTGVEVHKMQAELKIQEARQTIALVSGQTSGQTWHEALDAYVDHLKKKPDPTGWINTQIKQTQRLKAHHPDIPLTQLNLTKCEELIDFWRHRPLIKDKVVAATTARNHVVQLGIVFKWLHRNDQFAWRKPEGLEDAEQKVQDHRDDPSVIEVDVFTVDDLKTLWTYASPLVRVQMALALNSAFKEAEIGSLTFREIYLNQPYPGIARHNRPEGLGSWIKRIRRKTKVYGEWQLWPVTVAGIEWATANRKHQPKGTNDTLLVTKGGKSMDARTSGGNRSDKIYSSWRSLYRTLKKHGQMVKYLSFKHLEKTALDWLRSHYDGEIASMFACHGKPVKNDSQLEAYANKPYPGLFNALAALGEYLRPVFEAVPDPWKARVMKTAPDDIAKIKELRSQGMKVTEIAGVVGMHPMSVSRILRREK